jgi:hypothetical protein
MPLNSVMQHTKEAISGTIFPTGLTWDGVNQVPNLQAHISPPVGTVVSDGPHAFVWGSTLNEKRQTMGGPRTKQISNTAGFRNLDHRIDIVVRYALPASLVNIDSCFPAIVDSIMEVLRGIQMPITINDELTGRQSTIQIIGEEFQVQNGQIYALTDQRYWLYGAKITMPVKEVLQQ